MEIKGLSKRLPAFCKFLVTILSLAVIMVAGTAQGEEKAEGPGMVFGLGIILGEPTGLSAKYWLSRHAALDFAAAWDLSGDDEFQFHADYLLHKYGLIQVAEGKLPLFFGIGGRVKHEEHRRGDDTLVGIRIPVGLSYEFEGIPLEIFGEVVPIMDVAPDTEADINVGVGVRYYF